ncbi:unnamed protein product [Trichobilharzia regenti]|nr:unnamed protein product [Trichobilharzia regenti]
MSTTTGIPVYGITVNEYIHWYIMQSPGKRIQHDELYCPIHSLVALWAPDLVSSL